MAITAKDVQKLREMTGVGMMDCKKALTEAEGDFDTAIEWLREKGLAAQTKKAGKVAAEGVSYAIVADNGVGVVIEVNSQTDFVAKNEVFQDFVKTLASIVANENPADVEALKACTYPGTDRTVADVTADKVLAIGENIQIRRFVRYAEGVNVPYIHMGGKIGVLVNLAVEGVEADKVIELGKDVAMQIAAMNPAFLDKSDVSQETLDKEKEIQLAMMANDPKMAAKPEKVKEGIVMGKLGKYYEENCLLQQAFVKENKVSVEKHVAAVAKELGGKITADYKNSNLMLVTVLKGAVVFLADLMRQIDVPAEIDFMVVSSYGSGVKSSGVVKIVKDLDVPLAGKDILIVEDILDSGLTLSYIKELLESRGPRSIRIATLLDKPSRRKVDLQADYIGFSVPDEFVIGYGLDYDEKYRNLPYIGILKPEVYSV